MAAKERHTFLIDSDLLERMTAMTARTGLSRSEQVRRGIQLWLGSREWPVHASDGRESRSLPLCAALSRASSGALRARSTDGQPIRVLDGARSNARLSGMKF